MMKCVVKIHRLHLFYLTRHSSIILINVSVVVLQNVIEIKSRQYDDIPLFKLSLRR